MLTAAHCVLPGAEYKVILPGETPPRLLDVRRMASHPQFNVAGILAHRASADVALLQLAAPLPASKAPAPLGSPVIPIQVGSRFTIAGVGVTRRGDGKSGGTIRAADLAVTGKPGTLTNPPRRSAHQQSSRGPRRLHRRFRRACASRCKPAAR